MSAIVELVPMINIPNDTEWQQPIESVVDVSGVNRISARMYANAVGAVVGMVETAAPQIAEKPLIAASMFGNTTDWVDRCREILESKGYEVLRNDSPETSSGIVSFRKQGVDAVALVRLLKDAAALAASRQGWVRASPHFYVSPEEVERVLEVLP